MEIVWRVHFARLIRTSPSVNSTSYKFLNKTIVLASTCDNVVFSQALFACGARKVTTSREPMKTILSSQSNCECEARANENNVCTPGYI